MGVGTAPIATRSSVSQLSRHPHQAIRQHESSWALAAARFWEPRSEAFQAPSSGRSSACLRVPLLASLDRACMLSLPQLAGAATTLLGVGTSIGSLKVTPVICEACFDVRLVASELLEAHSTEQRAAQELSRRRR